LIDLDYDQVSLLLSELSQPSVVPKLDSRLKAPRPFEIFDVSFETRSWLANVLEVTIWLNLDSTFKTGDSPETVASLLFDELSPGKADEKYSITDGMVELTEIGVQNLEERLSRASANRSIFVQLIEDEHSVASATEAWIEAWDEPIAIEPLSINASVDKWRINDFSGIAAMGKLELTPTYQRGFVWSNAQSQMLIESILRGIPLPSIILERDSNSQRHQIVDGKQRLTAILRFMGSHPEGLENAKGMKAYESFATDFGLFARRNALRAADIREKYLPFKTKKYTSEDPLFNVGGRYYCEIKNKKVRIAGDLISVSDLFE